MPYLTAKELAAQWNISTRRINQLCTEGKLLGAMKKGKFWYIPDDVSKPDNLRKSNSVPLLPCPVGITSYIEASTECYYVDKTLMLKDLIDDHSKVYLFTRPRRFGKTLTMDMIRTFFEKQDTDTSIYFTDRNIWSCGEQYRNKQGIYPVIFLSFKDAHNETFEEIYQSICYSIREEYLRHYNKMSPERINEYDHKYMTKILNDEASDAELKHSLGKLSSILSTYYKQKVIVIIDEYDTPIQQGHIYSFYKSVTSFMRTLLSSVLKDNPHLEFGVLSGILRIAKESLFSGLNNLMVNTILDEKYSQYFGFTKQDVTEMAIYYRKKDKLTEMKTWYDGYLFGNTEVYNPWSVISYFNNDCVPKSFWSRTSGNQIISQMLQTNDISLQDNLSKLLQGEPVEAVVDTDIIYPDINSDINNLYNFLLLAGYLRISEIIGQVGDNPICRLVIPNKEILSAFQKEILEHLTPLFTSSIIRDFELSIRNGDTSLFEETLQTYLLQSASTFDTAKESFYHGTVFGMLAMLTDKYRITSNRESGNGRYDISLVPWDTRQTGYIIEFKSGSGLSENELEKEAMTAIDQIINKKYETEMSLLGIPKIKLFGIAFSGKNVVCRSKDIIKN